MGGVGKHFPGHGGVVADSHHALPVDGRSYEDLRLCDLVPFERLAASELAGVMPAHVVYECLDVRPAGFSRRWIGDVLRGELGFQGIVFSDDLDMAAATTGGDHLDRALAALEAGCDMVLVCNDWPGAIEVVDGLKNRSRPGADGANGKDARSRRTVVRANGVRCGVSARCRRDLVAGSEAGARIG